MKNIDESQFLPEKELNPKTGLYVKRPVVNAWRAKHGDLVVHDKSALVRDITVLGELIRKGFLEEHHRQAAMCLLEMRNAFLGKLGHKTNMVVIISGEECGLGEALDVFDEICRIMRMRRVRTIYHAAAAEAQRDAACMVIEGIQVYQQCFEMLHDGLETAWKNARKRREEAECRHSG